MSGHTTPIPGSWGLTEAEIEQLAEQALGEPAEADNNWRPEGGSLLAGIGQCLVDEITGLWDLANMLWELNADLDIAADGENNWEVLRNHGRDAANVGALFAALNSGSQQFMDLGLQQRLALFRLYAKYELIKKTLIEIGKAGLNLLAAYDVYWNTSYEVLTINQAENALKVIADTVSLFFDDNEWQELADGGKALAERVAQLMEQRFDADPWGTAGYVVCLVALFFSPTKIARALRGMAGALDRLGRASSAADLARILRANNVDVPTWLGGRGPDAGDAADAVEDVVDGATPPRVDDRPNGADTPEAERAEGAEGAETPTDPPTPDPDRNTTNVLRENALARNRVAGEMAEIQARADLEAQGYEVNTVRAGSSDAGIDLVGVRRDDMGNITEIRVVEVKSTQFGTPPDTSLNGNLQTSGGVSHLNTMLDRTIANSGGNYSAAQRAYARELRTAIRRNGVTPTPEVWRYQVDTFNDTVHSRATAPWTARSSIPADEFDIDTGFSTATGLRDRAIDVLSSRDPALNRLFNGGD